MPAPRVAMGVAVPSSDSPPPCDLTHSLRTATRPVTLTFRDIQFSQLRRQYNELQTRFSILSVQANLSRGTLRDTAEAGLQDAAAVPLGGVGHSCSRREDTARMPALQDGYPN